MDVELLDLILFAEMYAGCRGGVGLCGPRSVARSSVRLAARARSTHRRRLETRRLRRALLFSPMTPLLAPRLLRIPPARAATPLRQASVEPEPVRPTSFSWRLSRLTKSGSLRSHKSGCDSVGQATLSQSSAAIIFRDRSWQEPPTETSLSRWSCLAG